MLNEQPASSDMTSDFKPSLDALNEAGARRDRAGVLSAGQRYLDVCALIEARVTAERAAAGKQTEQTYNCMHDEQEVGAALMTGAAAGIGATCRARYARRSWDDSPSPFLFSMDETEYTSWDLDQVIDVRLLTRDWRPLPVQALSGLSMLRAKSRNRIKRYNALFTALENRDPAATDRAISAIDRNDDLAFSPLIYALYHDALAAGIAVTIPRRYSF